VIVGENQGLDKLTSTHSPYLNKTIKPRAAFLTRYEGVTLGGSLANYMGMTAGRFTRCDSNDDSPVHCHHSWNSLFSQLDARSISWRQWGGSADNACDIFDHGSAWSKNIYTVHHMPAVYLTRIEGGRYDEALAPSAECRHNALATGTTAPNDTSSLDAALKSGQVGHFNLIVPNDCQNGHDPCAPTNDGVRQFDDFLAAEVPKIQSSPAFGSNGVIMITYDSGTSPKQPYVLFDALGPLVKPGVYGGRVQNHYGLLRTMEDGFGLRGYLGGAAQAAPINEIWK
jgi:hypothetical protein